MLPTEPQGDIGVRSAMARGRVSGIQNHTKLRTWPSLAVDPREKKGTAGVRGGR